MRSPHATALHRPSLPAFMPVAHVPCTLFSAHNIRPPPAIHSISTIDILTQDGIELWENASYFEPAVKFIIFFSKSQCFVASYRIDLCKPQFVCELYCWRVCVCFVWAEENCIMCIWTICRWWAVFIAICVQCICCLFVCACLCVRVWLFTVNVVNKTNVMLWKLHFYLVIWLVRAVFIK